MDGGDPFDINNGCELDGLPWDCNDLERRVGGGSATIEKVHSNGRVEQAANALPFGSSVWVDRWQITSSIDIGMHDIGSHYYVNVAAEDHGYFLTTNDGLSLANSAVQHPQNTVIAR